MRGHFKIVSEKVKVHTQLFFLVQLVDYDDYKSIININTSSFNKYIDYFNNILSIELSKSELHPQYFSLYFHNQLKYSLITDYKTVPIN